jgi:IS5 family transposase
MLRLTPSTPVETFWDHLLPSLAQQLPAELAAIDQLLADPQLLVPFRTRWDALHPGDAPTHGRPTIPMATYLRVMVLKHRYGWGYETLMQEIADSLHLRRFCLIPIVATVPHESTVRKLTRRLGPDLIDAVIRGLVAKALRERRFRPRALRADSTVAESDIRFPTDSGLCADGVTRLARVARTLRRAIPTVRAHVRDRSRAVGRCLRALGRSLRRRTGEAKGAVQRFTEQAATHLRTSLREATRVVTAAKRARARAPGVSPTARRRAIQRLEDTIRLATRIVEQVRRRFADEKIEDRLVSFADPDARPVRRGKAARPNEFGYVVQLAEVTEHTRRGARGLLLPPKLRAGSTHENALFPETIAELTRLEISLREGAFDAGFLAEPTTTALRTVGGEAYITGTPHPGSRRTRRRLACYRVGAEGRIAHLKREYGAGRSQLRGTAGARIWEGWAVFTYNLDTLAQKQRAGERKPPTPSPPRGIAS